MKVGDLVREKRYSTGGCGIIVKIGDLRTKKPYKVYCSGYGKVVAFKKKYIQEDCEVISESR